MHDRPGPPPETQLAWHIALGRAEAQRRRTEHFIHNMDGTVAERNSYGSDPTRRG